MLFFWKKQMNVLLLKVQTHLPFYIEYYYKYCFLKSDLDLILGSLNYWLILHYFGLQVFKEWDGENRLDFGIFY